MSKKFCLISIAIMCLFSFSLEAQLFTGGYQCDNGKWELKDKSGKVIIPCKYDRFSRGTAMKFVEGLGSVLLNSKWGFVDTTGREVVPCMYDYVEDYYPDGFARVKLNGKQIFIDKTGKESIPPKYDNLEPFQSTDGFKLWGFKDAITGIEIVPCGYDMVWKFGETGEESLAGVRAYDYNPDPAFGRLGFIDKTGRPVTDLKYIYIDDFVNGYAKAFYRDRNLSGYTVYLDKTGKEFKSLPNNKVAENLIGKWKGRATNVPSGWRTWWGGSSESGFDKSVTGTHKTDWVEMTLEITSASTCKVTLSQPNNKTGETFEATYNQIDPWDNYDEKVFRLILGKNQNFYGTISGNTINITMGDMFAGTAVKIALTKQSGAGAKTTTPAKAPATKKGNKVK